jgi:phage-related protein
MSVTERPLIWVGTSKKDLLEFPDTARRSVGYALGMAQAGGKHPDAKPWKGEGPGVFEVVAADEGNAFRAVYAVRFVNAVYVLHCFQKKSPSGIRTAASDVNLVGQRLAAALKHYEEHYAKKS